MVVVDALAALQPGARLTLVSGASRSGKSRWAEHLASAIGGEVVVLVTGPPAGSDPDWQRRVAEHRRRRPARWQTLEVEAELADGLRALRQDQLGLVDSLGTWVAAHLDADTVRWEGLCSDLIRTCQECSAPLIVVCEETGWGVVPATAVGGLFRDRLGMLQQRICGLSDRSWLVTAGRAIDLTNLSLPVP